MKRKLMLFGVLATLPVICTASNITLQGNFTADDDVQLFSVTLAAPAAVDFRSYGYAGGTTSTGTVVPAGGFDTVLTLFTGSGVFIDDNDDGAGVATDPATGLAADARITANLAAGSYTLALTQYDNFSLGDLSDGFVEAGNPNFTADPTFTSGGACPGNMFRDISGTAGRCRTGDWTIDFIGASSVTPAAPVPEPSALLLAGIGLALLLLGRIRASQTIPSFLSVCLLSRTGQRKQRKRCARRRLTTLRAFCAAVLGSGVVAAIFTLPLHAQTNCPTSTSGPDYCHVSDFLNGQRTLLNITDLQAFRLSSYNNNDGGEGNNIGNGQDIYQITTSGSTQTLANKLSEAVPQGNPAKPLLSFSAHMLAQRSAMTLTTMADFQGSGSFALWLQNVDQLNGAAGQWYPLPKGDNPTVEAGAVGDLTLDGYDDMALSFDDGKLVVFTAADTTNVFANIKENTLTTARLFSLAIGDFKGDGHREVAGITLTATGGPAVVIYTVDPVTLALATSSVLNLTPPSEATANNPVVRISLARGRFNSAGHDQLAVAFATATGSVFVEVIDFALGTLNPVEGPQLVASTVSVPTGHIEVTTAPFGLPGNSYDQIVFHTSSTNTGGKFFEVLSADPTSLALTAHAAVGYDAACAMPIQVGNFDNRQTDQSGQTGPNLNSQIAFLYCTGSPRPDNPSWDGYNGVEMNIYNVNPTTYDIESSPTQLALGEYFWLSPNAGVTAMTFVATDLQGRSVTLGDPTKVSISNAIQPTAVIGVPPMHVDYIDPGDGSGPRVLNLSVVPDGFKTTYNQQSSSGYASNTTNTTSWSFGAKETASAGFTIGDPETDYLKVSDTFTAAQTLNGSHEHDHGAYNTKSFNISATTGFGDEVSYTDNQFNIWIYPVIGQTVCPASKPNCQPSEKVPLTIQFAAPDGQSQQPEAVQGQALQWYQPPWEPGNVFSYPANLDQLKIRFPNLSQLTNDTTGFLTDGSTLTQSATWSGSGEEADSTGLEQNYSFENDLSVSGGINIAEVGVEGSYGLDISGSVGFNNLTKTTTTLGKSTGLEISKPGTFPAFQNFGYSVTPYVMGMMQPGGLVDNQPLTADIKTVGVLRAMFTADPLSTDPPSGGWWQQAYTAAPDVALNHPSRWTYATTSQPSKGDPPSNCLLTGDGKSMDCAELNPRSPHNPWLSIFHFMRGFFISSAASPGMGPQLEEAKAGDKLALQARVYNYSLLPMPDGTVVHVRFYFMPWNTTRNLPVGVNGESYLISEKKVAAIPPFNESSGPNAQPNWTLVSTTFDTSAFQETKAGNVHLVFWVVVWMDNGAGTMVTEMPVHGLTQIPPAGTVDSDGETTFHFAGVTGQYLGATDFEETEPVDGNSYSNNVGLYKQVFYIAPNSLGAAPPTSGSLDIGKVQLSSYPTQPNGNTVLSATIYSRGAAASGVSVNFYDGNPSEGGRLFDVERIPHIDANGEQLVETTYQSSSCGLHQLFAVVNRGTPSEVVRSVEPLRIPCSTPGLATP